MSNLFNENYAATDDTGDVKIVIKGNDCNKSSNGASSIYAFCNHCKKDISVVYIKSGAKGKELEVTETTDLIPRTTTTNARKTMIMKAVKSYWMKRRSRTRYMTCGCRF